MGKLGWEESNKFPTSWVLSLICGFGPRGGRGISHPWGGGGPEPSCWFSGGGNDAPNGNVRIILDSSKRAAGGGCITMVVCGERSGGLPPRGTSKNCASDEVVFVTCDCCWFTSLSGTICCWYFLGTTILPGNLMLAFRPPRGPSMTAVCAPGPFWRSHGRTGKIVSVDGFGFGTANVVDPFWLLFFVDCFAGLDVCGFAGLDVLVTNLDDCATALLSAFMICCLWGWNSPAIWRKLESSIAVTAGASFTPGAWLTIKFDALLETFCWLKFSFCCWFGTDWPFPPVMVPATLFCCE